MRSKLFKLIFSVSIMVSLFFSLSILANSNTNHQISDCRVYNVKIPGVKICAYEYNYKTGCCDEVFDAYDNCSDYICE